MSTTTEQIEELGNRVTKLEVDGARLDERLSSLVQSTANLKWTIWSMTLLLLLAVIYGALGPNGFSAVTSA